VGTIGKAAEAARSALFEIAEDNFYAFQEFFCLTFNFQIDQYRPAAVVLLKTN
jgi:hypothetical protein